MIAQRHHKLVIELIRVMAVAVALLMLTVLTVSRSQAAFSATTVNNANAFNTGTVALVDDDNAAAMFNAAGMSPGTPVVQCIEVTYQGSLTPADIKIYGTTGGTGLAALLDTTIELGTGGGYGDCASFTPAAGAPLYSGTLAGFSTAHTDWSNGLAVFTAAANPTPQVLRFTVEVQNNPAAQGLNATADFTFEAQDT